jgi:predicted DNA-binding protein YlxM (UPF0122 family)
MEKKIREQYLFDFYGELLTQKQKAILDYYYNDDYSLAEIAAVISVTRQGIFDVIKRSRHLMERYEEKLKLVEKFLSTQSLLNEIDDTLNELLNCSFDDNQTHLLNEVILKLKKVSEEN